VNGPRMPATSPRPCCSTTRRVSNSATTEFFQSGGSRASVSQVSGFPELRHQGVIGIVRWSSGKEGEVATLDDLVHLLDPALRCGAITWPQLRIIRAAPRRPAGCHR
jgi:hypothetical protein